MASFENVGVRRRTNWLREDLGSGPYAWLRHDFVPPSPFLVVKDPQTRLYQILVEPHFTEAEFRKAWMLFSVGMVILWSLLTSSWILLGISCLKSLTQISLGLWDGTCRRWLGQRSPLLGVWMVGLRVRFRLCLYLVFLVWLFC